MTLFRTGSFTLHAGGTSNFKIDCDALTDEDWESLANIVSDHVGQYSAVEGVPGGGLKLAKYLGELAWVDAPLLIVDDVLTTGTSMEEQRAGRDAKGFVVFARGPLPGWVKALFVMRES